jgi:hypothetical protein
VARPNPRQAQSARATAPTSGERLTRRRRTADPFAFDQRVIPAGFSYEWKRESVHGQPDNENMRNMRENHWKPVPASRHPELAIEGDTIIRRGGTILMERPKYLTEEAQMEDLQEALNPVQQMEEIMYGTKPGEFTRDHPSVRKVSKVRQKWAADDPGGEEGGGLSAEP